MSTSIKYPTLDRSDFIPHKKKQDEDDHIDLNQWNEIFSDGRPYRAESWAAYQMTFITYYFSIIDMEDYSNPELKDYLVSEGVIAFDDNLYKEMGFEGINVSVGTERDKNGNVFWKITIIIGDEDGIYARDSEKPKWYERSVSVQHRTEDSVLHCYINAVCERIANSVKRYFIKDKSTTSGDSGLINVWEEYCTQVQGEHSIFWDTYEDLFIDVVRKKVNALSEDLKTLIWFQIENNLDEENDENYSEEDIVYEIYNHFVGNKACDYTNSRIEKYLGP